MKISILFFRELDREGLKRQIDKVALFLEKGDFRGADARKLKGTSFYRARLDDTNRLLFRFASFGGQRVILILEVIRNHAYEKSRFLRGGHIADSDFSTISEGENLPKEDIEELRYVNESSFQFHFLDRVLSLDEDQNNIFSLSLPLILIGSAGSGKTVVTLEKMKECLGDVLYISHSRFLVESSRNLFYASGFENENQNIEFLSSQEFLQTMRVPQGREVTFRDFSNWFSRMKSSFKDARKLYEEFRGIITGHAVSQDIIDKEDYLALGVKQSILLEAEREEAYPLFQRFVRHMSENNLFDPSILASQYENLAKPSYDWVVVDEVQDFTTAQLALVLRTLRNPCNFLLTGDSNQIVHPNFFSWARLKTFLYNYGQRGERNSSEARSHVAGFESGEILRVLHTNYRNGRNIVSVANRLLRLKQARFGSLDRESNYLATSLSKMDGVVDLLQDVPAVRKELNEQTALSAQTAILVLSDESKAEAERVFASPLIFSVHEAKGLEYHDIVLFNIVSDAEQAFRTIASGISHVDLDENQNGSLEYARGRDKTDKSGEAFKFYINAFYVALTRAINGVFIVERNHQHSILRLLGFSESSQKSHLKKQESTKEEWQREARKLELQGKIEQANRIKSEILQCEPVPWTVYDDAMFAEQQPRAFDANKLDKKVQRAVFEYAVAHNYLHVMPHLVAAKYSFAKDLSDAPGYLARKYFPAFLPPHTQPAMTLVKKHGLEFLTQLGETPLTTAARVGNVALAELLVAEGADRDVIGPSGLTSFGLALREAVRDSRYRNDVFEKISKILAPSSLIFKIDDKMFKLDSHKGEFFVLMLILSTFREQLSLGLANSQFPLITSEKLENMMIGFVDKPILAYRCKRKYINAVLARSEFLSNEPRSFRFLVRTSRGLYTLNPAIDLKIGENWKQLVEVLGMDVICATKSSPPKSNDNSVATDLLGLNKYSKNNVDRKSTTELDNTEQNALFLKGHFERARKHVLTETRRALNQDVP